MRSMPGASCASIRSIPSMPIPMPPIAAASSMKRWRNSSRNSRDGLPADAEARLIELGRQRLRRIPRPALGARLLVAALRAHRRLVRRKGDGPPAAAGREPRRGQGRASDRAAGLPALHLAGQGRSHRPPRRGRARDPRLQDRRRSQHDPGRCRLCPAIAAGGGHGARRRLRGHRRSGHGGARLLAPQGRSRHRRHR